MALQVNNWNEERKIRNDAINTLGQIKEELNMDILYFNRDLSETKSVIQFLERLSNRQYNDLAIEETFQIVTLSFNNRDFGRSYHQLENAGHLKYVKDAKLLNWLSRYYEICNNYNYYVEYHSKFTSENIQGFLLHKLPLDKERLTTSKAVINEIENGNLMSLINYQLGMMENMKTWDEEFIKWEEKIIALIELEVKN